MGNRLFLLSNIDFKSETGASWARVMNYARALSASGTEVYLTSKLNRPEAESTIKSTGIEKAYFLGMPQSRVKKKLNDVYLENLYFIEYYRYIRSIFKQAEALEGKRSFLLYPGNLAMMVVALFYLKILKRERVFVEKNEMMTGIAMNYPLSKSPVKFIILSLVKLFLFISGFIQDVLTPFFSGMIAISTSIEKLYRGVNSHILRIPILCNNMGNETVPNPAVSFSIGYTGDINQNKDGIFSFIRVLGKIKPSYEFDFYAWGSVGGKTQFSKLTAMINELGLTNQIHFEGLVKSSELTGAIANLDLLVLPRPLNFQTRYGFSTKLGEYMISGIPVLATDVSDNGNYISDGQNGFLVKAGDDSALQETLKKILEMPKDKLRQIGLQGKETATENFVPAKYAEPMNAFFFPN